MPNALFSYTTPNLGDDTQSLATAMIMGAPDCYVDRDRLDGVRLPERHTLVMNSWFAIKRYEAIPEAASIEPVFFGYCMGRRELVNDKWLTFLARHQPIGCRDTETVEWLTGQGIEAHMTGCITLWMGHRLTPVPQGKRQGIYMVDVPEGIERLIPVSIRERAVRLTQEPDKSLRWAGQKARFRAIARFYDMLAGAELVLTRRLHTMLPCVAFQTPVIGFVPADRAKDKNMRFGGYDRFIALARYRGDALLSTPDYSNRTPAVIPADLQQRFESLLKRVGNRMDGVRFSSISAAVEDLFPADNAIVRYPQG